MIRLVICKTTHGGTDVPPDFPFLAELIAKTKDEKLKRARTAAYLTLKYSYEKFYDQPLPTLVKSVMGRPGFKEERGLVCDFNISHTDGLCAVAYLDGEGRIGVDAEEETESYSHTGIAERFLKNVNTSSQKRIGYIEIVFAEAVGSDIRFFDTERIYTDKVCGAVCYSFDDTKTSFSVVSSDDFFSGWCALEAVLKAEGGGFSSLSSSQKLLSKAELLSIRVVFGTRVYRVSLAHLT